MGNYEFTKYDTIINEHRHHCLIFLTMYLYNIIVQQTRQVNDITTKFGETV